jgi:type II secretory pathway pseudopilin PulG
MIARNQKGLSLVEVVLALGLLATVLISVGGMYILSDRQVKSGRSSSEAMAVGRAILEEMQGWGFRQTYLMFGLDGSARTYTLDTRTAAYGDHWQAALDETLVNAWAEIEISSLGPVSPVPLLQDTRNIRVLVTVHWDEGIRSRAVRLAMARN